MHKVRCDGCNTLIELREVEVPTPNGSATKWIPYDTDVFEHRHDCQRSRTSSWLVTRMVTPEELEKMQAGVSRGSKASLLFSAREDDVMEEEQTPAEKRYQLAFDELEETALCLQMDWRTAVRRDLDEEWLTSERDLVAALEEGMLPSKARGK
jgi:hypothetical protein